MSSLRELSITDALKEGGHKTRIEIAPEPSFVALGPKHVAVGMNNFAWFYSTESTKKILEREYLGTVDSMSLNAEFAAVLCEGNLQLHPLADQSLQQANFPEKEG